MLACVVVDVELQDAVGEEGEGFFDSDAAGEMDVAEVEADSDGVEMADAEDF